MNEVMEVSKASCPAPRGDYNTGVGSAASAREDSSGTCMC